MSPVYSSQLKEWKAKMRIISNVSSIYVTELGKLDGDASPSRVESVRVEMVWGHVVIDTYSDGTSYVNAYPAENLPNFVTFKQVNDHGFKISTVNGKV